MSVELLFGVTNSDLYDNDFKEFGRLVPPQHVRLDFRDHATIARFHKELSAYFPSDDYPKCTGKNYNLFHDIFGDAILANWSKRLTVELLLKKSQLVEDPELALRIAGSFNGALESAVYHLIQTGGIGTDADGPSRFTLCLMIFDG